MNQQNSLTINKKKTKNLKTFILLILILFFIIIALKSSFFNISTIIVNGNNMITDEEVILLSQLRSKNIFLFQKSNIEELIKNNPYVEEVKIKRQLPSKVIINVVEKKIRGVIQIENSFVNIDEKGRMIQKLDKFPNNKLITVEGTKISHFNSGDVVFKDEKHQKCLVELLKIYEFNDKFHISKINVANPDDIVLETSNGYTIKIGNCSNLEYKLGYVYSIINSPSVKGNKGIIELHSDGVAVFKKK